MLFVARMIDGATAGNLTIAQAYISDVTQPENRARSFAVIGIAFGLGFLVGPAISGYLAGFGYQAPIFAASGLSFTTILCTFFILPRHEVIHEHNAAEDPGPGGRRLSLISWGQYRRYFRDRELARLLMQWLLFSFSFSTFVSGFALFAERRYQWNGHAVGLREVGYIFAFNGFLGIIMQGGMVGRMVKWMGERKVVRLGFITALGGLCRCRTYKNRWPTTVGDRIVVRRWCRITARADEPGYSEGRQTRTRCHHRPYPVFNLHCPDRSPDYFRDPDRPSIFDYVGNLGRLAFRIRIVFRAAKSNAPLPRPFEKFRRVAESPNARSGS